MNHSRNCIFWSAAILMPAAFFFGTVGELPYVPVLTALLLLFAGISSHGWRVSDRTIVYNLVLALALTAFGNYMAPFKGTKFGMMAIFSRPGVTVPFCLYAAALTAGFRHSGSTLAAAVAAVLWTYGPGADLQLEQGRPMVLRGIGLFFNDPRQFYFWSAGISGAAALLAARFSLRRTNERSRSRSLLATLMAGAVFAGILWGSVTLYRHNEFTLRNWENALLRLGMFQISRSSPGSGKVSLDSRSNLFNDFWRERDGEAQKVLLRAVGSKAPGYLRGSVLHRYEHGTWSCLPGLEKFNTTEIQLDESGTRADQLYKIRRMERTGNVWNFYPDSSLDCRILPIPGNTVSLEAITDQLESTDDGRIRTAGLTVDAGYTVYTDSPAPLTAYNGPATPPAELTYLAARLRPRLRKFNRDLGVHKLKTAAEKIDLIRHTLSTTYEYSLDWQPPPRGIDPVIYFLERRKKGHCELFASALALLLRDAGIPTRYVTGLLCFEQHNSKQYYLSRLGDAHAWVEAFDPDRKEWIAVDATPEGALLRTPQDQWPDRVQGSLEYSGMLFRELFADLRRGKIIGGLSAFLWQAGRLTWEGLTHPAGIVFLLLLTALWGSWFYLRVSRNQLLPLSRRGAFREFRRFCRKLQKKESILFPSREPTAQELLVQIEKNPNLPEEKKQQYRQFLRHYQERRFR